MNRINTEIDPIHRSGRAATALLAACALVVALAIAGAAPIAHPTPAYAASAMVTTQAKTYDIVYKLNRGKQPAGQITTIAKGRTLKISKLKAPTRDRYKFVGWYSNRALTQKATKLKGVSDKAQRTVYAKWKLKSYNILYNLNGGTFKGSYTKTVGVDKTVKTSALVEPTRTGFSFYGWYTDKGLTKKAIKVKGVSDSSKRTLYAKWGPAKYVISYELSGGRFSGTYQTTYTTSKGLAKLPVPERTGYVFIGWYADERLTDHVTAISPNATGDKLLYARWVPRTTIAHHGCASDSVAANSLDAFKAAHEKGYKYVDVDVRFMADGTPVLATADGKVPTVPSDDSGQGTDAGQTNPNQETDPGKTSPGQETDSGQGSDPSAGGSETNAGQSSSATDSETQPTSDSNTGTQPVDDTGSDAQTGTEPPSDSSSDTQPTTDPATDSPTNPSPPSTDPAQTQQPVTFSEFLQTCRLYNLVPCIEVPGDATEAQVKSLIDMVYKSRLDTENKANTARWISSSAELLDYVQKNLAYPYLILQASKVTNDTIASAQTLEKLGSHISIATDADHVAAAVAPCKAAGIPLGVWTISADADTSAYNSYISTFSVI